MGGAAWRPEKLVDFFQYYDPKNDNHRRAVLTLAAAIPPALLADDAAWVQLYRTPVALQQPPANDNGVPRQAVSIIADFEGFRSEPYDDGTGVATIGYGSTFYADGRRVGWNDKPISDVDARQLLAIVIKRTQDVLASTVPDWSKMTDCQRSALLSFAYNLGAYFYGGSGFSTITRTLQERRWSDVPDAMVLYRSPGTSVEAGLLRRRKAEGELWRGQGRYAA